MDKGDAELTRKAVAEIMREMEENKERDKMPYSNPERKINPLGRANKRFLGRYLNAMVSHNKRTDERNMQKCRKKLRELDKNKRRYPRSSSVDSKSKQGSKRKKSRDSRDSPKKLQAVDSDSSDRSRSKTQKSKKEKSKSKHKRRKRKRTEHRIRESSSSSSSSTSTTQSSSSYEEIPRRDDNTLESHDYTDYTENVNNWMLQPWLWDVHMQQLHQFKALMALGAAQAEAISTVQIEEIVEKTKPRRNSGASFSSDITFEELSHASPQRSENIETINVSTEDDEDVPSKATECTEAVEIDLSDSSSCSGSVELVDSDSGPENSANISNPVSKTIDLTED